MLATVALLGPALSPATDAAIDEAIDRPTIGFYRWQEDWSVLAQPDVRAEPGDALKYIRLSNDDDKRYVSFGVTLRDRYEYNDAPAFGTTGQTERDYLIQRLDVHVDAHLTAATRVFVQVESAVTQGLAHPGAADANKLDLRLAFVDSSLAIGDGTLKYRLGRQEIAFDLQRFISVRDGPNVRQAYDAIWSDYEYHDWRLSGFASEPVQYRNAEAFDDISNRQLMYGGVRLQRRHVAGGDLSLTLAEYRNADAHFPAAVGDEHRRSVDLRYAGAREGFDWDVEGMQQRGSIAGKPVSAWAFGTLQGYTLTDMAWTPRVGLQWDAASGDRNVHDDRIGTFNPLFPNGYYVNLSGYTGYTNFIHFKPSLSATPMPGVKLLLAAGSLWRQTTHDAIYLQPTIAISSTIDQPGKRTSTYAQGRLEWSPTRALAMAFEVDRYAVAPVVKRAGGHDSDYVGSEVRWGW